MRRIAFLGDSGVGKTSFLDAALSDAAPPPPEPTYGVEPRTYRDAASGVAVQLWDVAGAPDRSTLEAATTRNAAAIVLLYTDERSFEALKRRWLPRACRASRRQGRAPPLLIVLGLGVGAPDAAAFGRAIDAAACLRAGRLGARQTLASICALVAASTEPLPLVADDACLDGQTRERPCRYWHRCVGRARVGAFKLA